MKKILLKINGNIGDISNNEKIAEKHIAYLFEKDGIYTIKFEEDNNNTTLIISDEGIEIKKGGIQSYNLKISKSQESHITVSYDKNIINLLAITDYYKIKKNLNNITVTMQYRLFDKLDLLSVNVLRLDICSM